jgi:hypothetical protein
VAGRIAVWFDRDSAAASCAIDRAGDRHPDTTDAVARLLDGVW